MGNRRKVLAMKPSFAFSSTSLRYWVLGASGSAKMKYEPKFDIILHVQGCYTYTQKTIKRSVGGLGLGLNFNPTNHNSTTCT
jgi:hypothetical protein